MKTNSYQIQAFARVMREGSFSAAAQKMGVTQSALSQHVAKLEARVGARLMMRASDGLVLTRAGAELFELAERYATLSQEINERLEGYTNFDSGHLSIIANAPQPALSYIADYKRRYPKVEINFTLVDWTRTMAMLSDHTVDIAFITNPRKSPDSVYKKLTETGYVLYVPADHPLALRNSVSLRDLTEETLILPEEGSLTQRVVTEVLERHQINLDLRLNTTTFPVMKETIMQGIGVGIFLADASVDRRGLAQVRVQELREPFDIYAAVPKYKFGLRIVGSFWNTINEAG